jgi:signal transduction histidine kinase/ligand-binding sensor domain-containing protein
LSGSDTSRNTAARLIRRLAGALALSAVVCLPVPARALDPSRALSQYLHDTWGVTEGFPGGAVYALAQTPDGYLWIGAEKGLVRFDGHRFRLFTTELLPAGTSPTVLGLAVDRDGSLWVRFTGPAVARYRDRAFEFIHPGKAAVASMVTSMRLSRAGGMLFAPAGEGLIDRGTATHSLVASALIRDAFIVSIAETTDGSVWLGTRDSGLLRVRDGRVSTLAAGLPDLKVNDLLTVGDDQLLIATDRGLARWTGSTITTEGLPDGLRRQPALAIARDRDGNAWIAAGARGLLRLRPMATSVENLPTASDVRAVFEDRDGDIWIGTARGIERLREGALTSFSGIDGVDGEVGAVYADPTGRVWVAPSTGGLRWIRDGVSHQVADAGLNADVVYSIAGDRNNLWVGRQRGGLTRLEADGDRIRATQFTEADGLAQNSVFAVSSARDGTIWAGTLTGGASRLRDGLFETFTVADGLASNTVAAVAAASDGAVWFGTPKGVSVLKGGAWRTYTTRQGLPSDEVNTLLEDSSGSMWVGTARGLVQIRDRDVRMPAVSSDVLASSILGLAQDKNSGLWVVTPEQVVRLTTVNGSMAVREFGAADGLRSLDGVKRFRSIVTDDRGRVWLARGHGIAMADPERFTRPAAPTSVSIEQVAADGSAVDVWRGARVPAGTQRITFAFTSPNLSAVDGVRFQYHLDGFDHDWSAASAGTEASYTNLGPGTYDYRVAVVTETGIGPQAHVAFTVAPLVWQTNAFRLAAVLFAIAVGWALYRVRVSHVERRINLRFEERLAERTRIARELHDTLLQGFVSASMQLDVAAEQLPETSPARARVSRVLELMRRVIDEGRNAVSDLRVSGSAADDLEHAFAAIPEQLGVGTDTTYLVKTDGDARALKPVIRDEVYRIGREALVNTFRHANATLVEVQVAYRPRELCVTVRDNGCGIDPQLISAKPEGHWGVPGMRERAERIGATFTLRSRLGAGTEIELHVPGQLAFDLRRTAREVPRA